MVKELGEFVLAGGVERAGFFPFALVKLVDGELDFDGGFAFGVEVAAGVAFDGFQEVIDAFGEVGGAKEGVHGSGVMEEGEVVLGAGFQVADPGFIFGAELAQEGGEQLQGAFEGGAGVDLAPGVLPELVVDFVEVAFGVAMEVDQAELVLGVREEIFEQGLEAGEVIGDQEEGAGEAAVFEIDEDFFPGLELFFAPEGGGAKDFFFSIQREAQDQEVGGGKDVAVLVFEVDVFGVNEQSGPVGGQGAGVEFFGLEVDIFEDLVQFMRGVTQAEALQGAFGGGEAFGVQEDLGEELVEGLGEVALVFGQERGVKAFARAGHGDGNGGRAQMEGAAGREAIGAVFGMVLQVDLALSLQGGVEELGKAFQEEFFELFFGQQQAEEFVLGDGSSEVSDTILQVREQLGRIHKE